VPTAPRPVDDWFADRAGAPATPIHDSRGSWLEEELVAAALGDVRDLVEGESVLDHLSEQMPAECRVGPQGHLAVVDDGTVTDTAWRLAPRMASELDRRPEVRTAWLVALAPGAAVAPAVAPVGAEVHLPVSLPVGPTGVASGAHVARYEFGRPLEVDGRVSRQVFNDGSDELRVLVIVRSDREDGPPAQPRGGGSLIRRVRRRRRSQRRT
jgi:hypothetical protein